MTFDKMCREMWIESCEKFGLKIEKEPIPEAKHNMTKEEMIRAKNKQMLEQNKKLEVENNELTEQIKDKNNIKKEAIKKYTMDNLNEVKQNAINNYLLGFINRIFEKLMKALGIKKEEEKDNFWNNEVKEYDNEYYNENPSQNTVKKDDKSESEEM